MRHGYLIPVPAMPRRKETTTYAEEEALKQKRIAERKAKKEQELKPIPAFSPEEVTVVFVLGKLTRAFLLLLLERKV